MNIDVDGYSRLAHRIGFLHYHGYLPEMLDHIDGDGSNNRIENLRECTASENAYNSKLRIDNTSGIKGVYWHKHGKKWYSNITVEGKVKRLGYFNDLKGAKKAVEEARLKYHGEFANNG